MYLAFRLDSDGGDFLPILKYDARAGRFSGWTVPTTAGFVNTPWTSPTTSRRRSISTTSKSGWALFMPNQAPSFALVPMGEQLPPRPSPEHKNGVGFLVKLHNCSAGDGKDVREVMGTSKAFLTGVEALYLEYQKAKWGTAAKGKR